MKSIQENLINFIIAFICALFIWLYVANMQNPIQTKTFNDVPLNIINLESVEEQNLSIKSKSIEKLSVTVKGRFIELQKFSVEDIYANIDLKDLVLKEGKNVVSVDININNPLISLIKEKSIMNVELDVETIIFKEIPIVLETKGSLKNEYALGDAIFSRNSVLCSGTKDDIDSIKYIAAVVNLSEVNDSIDDNIPLKAVNKNGEELKGIVLKDKVIKTTIPVYLKRDLPIEIKLIGNVPNGYKLKNYKLSTSKLTVVGEKSVVESIEKIYTEDIDISRRYSDFDKLTSLVFPEGVNPVNSNNYNVFASFIIEKDK